MYKFISILLWLYQQMYKKDIYRNNEVSQNPMQPNYNPQQPLYQEDKPYRDYDHQPYRYDGGYMEPKARNFDPHLHFDSTMPAYDEQWAPYDQTSGFDPHMPYEDGLNRMYGHPQMRHDTGYDASRPRYGKPSSGPIRQEPSPTRPQYDQEALPRTQASSRSPEPPKQQYYDPSQRPSYSQPPQRGYMNSEASVTPPKPESISPPLETVLPPPPAEAEDDPAMKPQSVLTRVKMFENKRSVSVDRARESADTGIRVS